MFTVRCTARLMRRVGKAPASVPVEPTTRLGDWHANLVHVGRHQLVLAASDRTLLPVLVRAAPVTTLVPRLRDALRCLLGELGVSRDAVEREDAAMAEFAYAPSSRRQVLGVLVDHAKALPFYLETRGSILDVNLTLARTPCGPLYKADVFPDRAAVALLSAGS